MVYQCSRRQVVQTINPMSALITGALPCLIVQFALSSIVLSHDNPNLLCNQINNGEKHILAVTEIEGQHLVVLFTDLSGFRVSLVKFTQPTGTFRLHLSEATSFQLSLSGQSQPFFKSAFIVKHNTHYLAVIWPNDHQAATGHLLMVKPLDADRRLQKVQLVSDAPLTGNAFFSLAHDPKKNYNYLVLTDGSLLEGRAQIGQEGNTIRNINLTTGRRLCYWRTRIDGGWTSREEEDVFFGFNNREKMIAFSRRDQEDTRTVSYYDFFVCDAKPGFVNTSNASFDLPVKAYESTGTLGQPTSPAGIIIGVIAGTILLVFGGICCLHLHMNKSTTFNTRASSQWKLKIMKMKMRSSLNGAPPSSLGSRFSDVGLSSHSSCTRPTSALFAAPSSDSLITTTVKRVAAKRKSRLV